ncbi:MAG: hypothetical protein IIW45_00360 [Alistipes sp.]|nr:hypothetical protein [Alistipes sp.]
MKKFYANFKSVVAAVVLASMTLAASCSYDDTGVKNELQQIQADLAALTERVAALEKRLGEEVEALTALIEGKVVVTEITKDAEGNTVINLSNGEKVTVLEGCDCVPTEPCDCDPLQYRVVDGVLEVSADGESWIAVKVAPECVVAEVTDNGDNTVTIKLANGEEFTVVKAEVIEFDSTRSQLYVLPGETKVIPFTINDAVADVNVMNQPLGWKAEVALAESEESEDNVDPDMGVLAAGGTEFVLNITGPAQEFVNAGFAEKEGYISVHFNSENGSCKVGKILVNLAEIKLNVDNAGNITLENTVAYEQTNYFGEKFVDFADFNIGIIPAEVYAQYGDKSFSDNYDDWAYEYTVNVASTKRSTGLGNVIDLQQYEEGVTEKEVYNFTVDQLAGAFWPKYTFEYGKEYVIFVSLEEEMVNYAVHPVLKGAVMDTYKKTLVEAEYVADSATWNDASYTLSLAGYQYYVIGWFSDANLNEYIEQGVADSVEAVIPMLIQNYGVLNAGIIVSGDFVDQTVTLSSLAESSLTGSAPDINPATNYHFFVYPFEAATEMELYQHTVVAENVYLFGTFETAALTEGTFDAGITYEVVTMNDKNLNVSAFFGEEVVAYYYAYYSSPAEIPADRALEIIEYEMMYDFSWSTYCEAYQYMPTYPAYLCIVAVNAEGEYVYVEEEFAPVPAPEVAITSFEYLGRYWEIADDSDETGGGEFVYLVKTADGNEFTINIYWKHCNADGSIIEGTYDYCYNQPDAMYGGWDGFSIISDSLYYDSKLVVAADKITLKLVGGENGPVDYVYVPGEGGEEPEPVANSFEYLGRYFDLDDNDETSGGGYMYKVVAGGVEYSLELYWKYANTDGAIKVGTYNYCYNTPDAMYSGWEGFSIISDSYYFGSTLEATADGVVTLTLKDENSNLIGEYVFEGVATFEEETPEPEQPTDVTELTISSHFSIYNEWGEHELGFYYDEVNYKFVDIDFLANPITAGTYTLQSGLYGTYCKSHGGNITEITVIVTDNGDGTLTFDATFKAGDGNWYHFTYTAKIYA